MKMLSRLFNSFCIVYRRIASHELTKNKKIRTLLRVCKFQILFRGLVRTDIVVDWVNDSKLLIGRHQTGATGNVYLGLDEYESMAFLLHALRPSDVFIDVGANVGTYTILASKVVGAPTIAFEPVPSTVQALKYQVAINEVDSLVDIRPIALGKHVGHVLFSNDLGPENGVAILGRSINTFEAKASSLDAEIGADGYYFVKIDVEGYEYNVINGGLNLLSSEHVLGLIVESLGFGSRYDLVDNDLEMALHNLGFFEVTYDPVNRNLRMDKQTRSSSNNKIYIRNLNTISKRCREASAFSLHTLDGFQI